MYRGLCLITVIAVAWAVSVIASRSKVQSHRPCDPEVLIDLDSRPQVGGSELDLSDWETSDVPAVTVTDVDLSQFDHLPPTYDPGLPVIRSIMPPAGSSPGVDGWPRVA